MRERPYLIDPRGPVQAALVKAGTRVIPILFILYFVNFLDRVNVSFAALQMNGDLGFTPAVYGLGASMFFLGYFFFEVPSNWVAARVGARAWLVRITVSWGIIACLMALVKNPTAFYVLRLLLGVAEAGFVPALLLYTAAWFPQAERANAVARLWSSTAFALILGGPFSALLLTLGGPLRGWQWMFLCEGVPAIALGFVLMRVLPASPATAAWLTEPERTALTAALAHDDAAARVHGVADFRLALVRPLMWGYAVTYLFLGVGFFGITFWLPQIVKQLSGLNAIDTSLLTAVPYIFAAAAMLIVGSRRRAPEELRRIFVTGCLIGAAGVCASALTANPWLSLTALTIGAMGIWSVVAIIWASASWRLAGTGAAAGLALINAIGGLGGFAGPYMIGLVKGATGSFTLALFIIAAALVVCGALAFGVMRLPAQRITGAEVPA